MDHAEQTRQLEERSVGRLLLEFSIPAILATIINASYSLINRFFVGRMIGEVGITAVTVSFPITTIMIACSMMIGIGSNTLVSIRLGEKNNKEAQRIVGQALFLFIMLAVGFLVFGLIFIEPLLKLFGASEQVMPYAKEYLSVSLYGAIFHELSYGMNGFLRSEGKPRIAMVTILIAALLNIFFDWLFLCVFRTTIWGAAYATILAQAVSTSWIIWHYTSGKTLLRWRLRYIRWNTPLAWQVFLLGLPPCIMQLVSCVLQGIQNRQLGFYGNLYVKREFGLDNGGDMAISVMGILFVVFMMVLLPLLGLNQGLQPIVGYNIGANRFDRVRRALKLAISAQLMFTVLCGTAIVLFPEYLIAPFTNPESPDRAALIHIGGHALRIVCSVLPLAGIVVIAAGYFQSNGMPKVAITLTLFRQVGFLVPLLFLLPWLFETLGNHNGLDGIWAAIMISDVGAFLLATMFFWHELRRLKNGTGVCNSDSGS